MPDKYLLGDKFIEALIESGLLPERTVKVKIEANIEDPIMISYTVLGDERWLDFAEKQEEAETKVEGFTPTQKEDDFA